MCELCIFSHAKSHDCTANSIYDLTSSVNSPSCIHLRLEMHFKLNRNCFVATVSTKNIPLNMMNVIINRALLCLTLKEKKRKKKDKKRAPYIGWPLVQPVKITTTPSTNNYEKLY